MFFGVLVNWHGDGRLYVFLIEVCRMLGSTGILDWGWFRSQCGPFRLLSPLESAAVGCWHGGGGISEYLIEACRYRCCTQSGLLIWHGAAQEMSGFCGCFPLWFWSGFSTRQGGDLREFEVFGIHRKPLLTGSLRQFGHFQNGLQFGRALWGQVGGPVRKTDFKRVNAIFQEGK